MLFKNIHFILVRPQLGENIGAAARSLKNFNFENLRLVSPRDSWPNKSAVYTAVEAKDIVHKAKLFTNNDQAVSDLDYIFATTSRSRSVNKKIIDLNEAVKIIKKQSILHKKSGIFFGPEASGLSNDDLINANYLVNIPTSNKFKSLNLSHAVTIFAFELFIASKPVMEGKAVLFKRFADIDSIDIEVDSQNADEIINCIAKIGNSFGGINLEDIASPDCFIIEQELKMI